MNDAALVSPQSLQAVSSDEAKAVSFHMSFISLFIDDLPLDAQ
jgi:hypothetical protein